MSETELAAQVEAEDIVTPAETQEGQDESQPAEVDTPENEAERSKSKERRERRKAEQLALREKAAEAERRAAEAEAKLAKMTERSGKMAEPKESDFADTFEYVAAKAAWKQAQMTAQMQADDVKYDRDAATAEAKRIAGAEIEARIAAFSEELPSARVQYGDFDVALAVAQRPDIVSGPLSEMVLESDRAIDLTYHLGKNPDLARALSAMPPMKMARELGRIEAALNVPKPKLKSDAPAPITPVRGSGTAHKDPSKMSIAEYSALRATGWVPS